MSSIKKQHGKDVPAAGKTVKDNRTINAKKAQRLLSRKNPDLAYLFVKLEKHQEYSFISNIQSVMLNLIEAMRVYDDYTRTIVIQHGIKPTSIESLVLNKLVKKNGGVA